jgi:hypothetical protein
LAAGSVSRIGGKSKGSLTAHAPTSSVEAKQSAAVVRASAARIFPGLQSISASIFAEELATRDANKETYAAVKIRERGK